MATEAQKKAFLDKYSPYAIQASKQSGIPASIILAQAIEESGWGTSTLSTQANNLFGIKKAGDWKGVTIKLWDTREKSYSDYRVYDSPLESFVDHSNFIAGNKRYANLFTSSDPFKWAQGLENDKYATNEHYAENLSAIIRSNKLTAYDTPKEGWVYPDDPRLQNKPSTAPTGKAAGWFSPGDLFDWQQILWFIAGLAILVLGLYISFNPFTAK